MNQRKFRLAIIPMIIICIALLAATNPSSFVANEEEKSYEFYPEDHYSIEELYEIEYIMKMSMYHQELLFGDTSTNRTKIVSMIQEKSYNMFVFEKYYNSINYGKEGFLEWFLYTLEGRYFLLPEEFKQMAVDQAFLFNMEIDDIYLWIDLESAFNPKAYNHNYNKAGKIISTDRGLVMINSYYQEDFVEDFWDREEEFDVWNAEHNFYLGIRILNSHMMYFDFYLNDHNKILAYSFASYNAGRGRVIAYLNDKQDLPEITKKYIKYTASYEA